MKLIKQIKEDLILEMEKLTRFLSSNSTRYLQSDFADEISFKSKVYKTKHKRPVQMILLCNE